MNKYKVWILLLSGMAGLLFSIYMHNKPQILTTPNQIPTIETFHSPAIFVKQLTGDPLAGKKIFQEFCRSCHADQPLIDVPAPRLHDKKAWQLKRKVGEDALLAITINGVGLMPARGGCFECSDEQLRETIRYILKENNR